MLKFITLFILSFSAAAADMHNDMSIELLSSKQQVCYSLAMIGYDSVVNSRVGSLPENALVLVVDNDFENDHPMSRINLLKTILSAYLWDGSAHSYAIKTLSNCVVNL